MTGVRLPGERRAQELMKRLRLVADTRERKNGHILDWCARNGIEVEERCLWLGDYTAGLGEAGMERHFVVERKHGIEELCVNLCGDFARFERELVLAKAFGTKVFLVVENAGWEDILQHNYGSSYPPDRLLERMCMLQARYELQVNFCPMGVCPQLVWGLLKAAAGEEVLHFG